PGDEPTLRSPPCQCARPQIVAPVPTGEALRLRQLGSPDLRRSCTPSGGPASAVLAYALANARAAVLGAGPPSGAPDHRIPRRPQLAKPLPFAHVDCSRAERRGR